MDFKTGYWLANDLAVNIILGWVPDFVMVIVDKITTPKMLYWQKAACEHTGSLSGRGWVMAHGNAVDNLEISTVNATDGIIAFNSSAEYVNVMSPVPARGKVPTAIIPWGASAVKVARSGTVIGSMVRPAVRNGFVYECTGAGTTNDTEGEPTFPTVPGATVTETDAVIWTCREEEVCRDGGKGFTVQSGEQADGEYCVFMAWRTDRDNYLGDADEGDLCII